MSITENVKLHDIIEKIKKGLRVDTYTAEDILYKVLKGVQDNLNVEEIIRETRLPLVTIIDILKHLYDAQLINYPITDFERQFEEYLKIKGEIILPYRTKHKTKYEYDQWKCDITTVINRVKKIIRDNYLIGRRILFLGDDDFTSIYLALAVDNLAEIHVIDIDSELLDLINELNMRLGLNIKTHNLDLRDPIPEYLRNKFDIFFTDPPFTYNGIALYLLQGFLSLKNEKGTKGYLCISPPSLMDDIYRIQQLIYEKGFYIDEIIKSFNVYPGLREDIPCIVSDLYVLKRVKIVPITEKDFENIHVSAIYTQKRA